MKQGSNSLVTDQNRISQHLTDIYQIFLAVNVLTEFTIAHNAEFHKFQFYSKGHLNMNKDFHNYEKSKKINKIIIKVIFPFFMLDFFY